MPQRRQYLPRQQTLPRRQVLPRWQDFPRGNPRLPGNPRIRPPGLRNPPSMVPTVPTGLPLPIPEWMITRLPRKGGYPQTRGGLSLLPRIFWRHQHLPLGCHGHRNVPHDSVSHYTTSPDSSGLRRPPNRTPLCSNGSFPSRPTSLPDRLNRARSCASPDYITPRWTIHNDVTELASDLHTPNSVKSHYYINFWIYIYLTTMNDTSLSNNQNTSVFFKNARPTPRLLVSP